MKRVFILPDGMADYPVASLGGKTPVEYANTPCLDRIVSEGSSGLVSTVPQGFPPGSDVCIMSLLGSNPEEYYTGRAPLEAVSLNIELGENDIAYRLNLINTSDDLLVDHCAGHISTSEANKIIESLKDKYALSSEIDIIPGVSYRHILVLRNAKGKTAETIPPHDIPGELITAHLPSGEQGKILRDIMMDSMEFLKNHPVNENRRARGLKEASMIWLWGGGYAPSLKTFKDSFNISGKVISAVSLVKGLASIMKMDVINVPGITGGFDTDYKAKGDWAIKALEDTDFILIHIEAPDEAGHAGSAEEKVKAIESIDSLIIKPIYEVLQKIDGAKLLISPDHYTPLVKKTHVADPVPFTVWGESVQADEFLSYSENNIKKSNLIFEKGFELMPWFLK